MNQSLQGNTHQPMICMSPGWISDVLGEVAPDPKETEAIEQEKKRQLEREEQLRREQEKRDAERKE